MLHSVSFWVLICSAFSGGLLGGMSLDKALVQLPARKRMGAAAYVEYSKAADLGGGLLWYPLFGVAAPLFAVIGAILVIVQHLPAGEWISASVAAVFAVLHLFTTSRAAPKMLRLRSPTFKSEEAEVTLRKFASWHTLRFAFQAVTFASSLWAVVAYLGFLMIAEPILSVGVILGSAACWMAMWFLLWFPIRVVFEVLQFLPFTGGGFGRSGGGFERSGSGGGESARGD